MPHTILITGASSGIGKASALLFQERGWNVAATMRTPEKAADLAGLPNLRCTRLDVTDPASIRQAVSETVGHFGGLDALLNNAGYGLVGPFEATTTEQIRRQFDTNVFGLMEVARAVLPIFREQKRGVLLNVSSIGGRITFPFYSLYHATKWAVEGFSESLQHELRPFNIQVKLIEPGLIKTDFYDRSMDLVSNPDVTAYDSLVARAVPRMHNSSERAASPRDVAEVIYRAATDGKRKLRYPAAGYAGLVLGARSLLPDAVFDGLIHRQIMR